MPAALGIRGPDINGATPTGPIDPNDDLEHYFHVAALVTVIYDHLLTFDSEVEYIWSKKWSHSKVLFILARYFGDLLLVSVCVVFLNRQASYLVSDIGLKFVGTGSMVIIIITQLIMQLRIKALYGRVVSTLVTVFWVMEVIAVLGLGIASLVAIDVHPVLLATARMCNPTYLPRFAFLFWVPVIAFESFLFSLALGIAYRNYLEIGNWRGASLLFVVLRDNVFFFICAFALYILTATTWIAANPRYFTVPGAFSGALTSIMGCRLIINLCEAYHHPRNSEETDSPPLSIWAVTTRNVQFVSMRGASKSAASGTPRWRSAQSRRGELVTTDFRLGMPGMGYNNVVTTASKIEEPDAHELHAMTGIERCGSGDDRSFHTA